MHRLWALALALVAATACKEEPSFEGGVNASNEGCGFEGTNSVIVGDYSCACEPGFDWCSEDPLDFECCAVEAPEETGDEAGPPPDDPCGADELESLRCILDVEDPNPGAATVWACNGERWVEVPGYAEFECAAQGLPFSYGCLPGPQFLCGFGPGSPCEEQEYQAVCVDEDIIDTCAWGRRTVDRCSRLCGELGAYGEGFAAGVCVAPMSKAEVAVCDCE